ncbi:hypothetical protein GCWU000341_01573 [Oribacterium sp. oral taxon 078 str. F0262]|nr:hypothetical protein GCWU000341_01573 [Oribacterium sp. oral taxon 078 str. F0262]
MPPPGNTVAILFDLCYSPDINFPGEARFPGDAGGKSQKSSDAADIVP